MTADESSLPLLTAKRVFKRFEGVQALAGADYDLRSGEVHAIVGENGAGKSTFGKILAGVVSADHGDLTLDGKPFRPANPHEAQSAGLAMIYQELDLFPHLTVAENMVIANRAFPEGAFIRTGAMATFAQEHLDAVHFMPSLDVLLGDLSVGEQQLVAIARALSMDVRIIVMDESTSALTEDAVQNLFRVIVKLKQRGVSIIYVSHKLEEVTQICDRVTVLRDGDSVGCFAVKDADVDQMVHLMVGRKLDRNLHARSSRGAERLLICEDVETERIRDITFTLHRGEVLGIAGLVGSGRTQIGRVLFGLDQPREGRMRLHGRDFCPRSPGEAIAYGVGLVPEDRKGMGLLLNMGVRENGTMGILDQVSRGGFIQRRYEMECHAAMAKETRLKVSSPDDPVRNLSGGNQQKVLLGRWLLVDSEVLFLDDPTRGVDVGAKEEIYLLIEGLASRGKGVLMVSSELPELLRCCDRILVMNQGRLVDIVDARATGQEAIMQLAAGQQRDFEER